MTDILMPALSPTMEEGKLAKWNIKAGDTVEAGQVIAEIETDKATMEVEAVDEGVVEAILVPEGTEGVKVNTPIAKLKGEGEAASAPTPAPQAAAPPAPPQAGEPKKEAPPPSPPPVIEAAKPAGEKPKNEGVRVPTAAISNSDGKDYAFVVTEQDTVEKRELRLGREMGDDRQVLQGLSAGESVVLDPPAELKEGTKVKLAEEAAE